MKKLNITYWIVTVLFSGFMIFSSIGGITLMPEAVAMLHDHLGYPLYFIQLVSYAKVAGAIAIGGVIVGQMVDKVVTISNPGNVAVTNVTVAQGGAGTGYTWSAICVRWG